jgi:hypothetical protein
MIKLGRLESYCKYQNAKSQKAKTRRYQLDIIIAIQGLTDGDVPPYSDLTCGELRPGKNLSNKAELCR